MSEETICGCGKPTRYMVSGGRYSCNKYARCQSYDELRQSLIDSNCRLLSLLKEILQDFDPYTCSKDMDTLIDDAKKIIVRNKAVYILYHIKENNKIDKYLSA